MRVAWLQGAPYEHKTSFGVHTRFYSRQVCPELTTSDELLMQVQFHRGCIEGLFELSVPA